MNRNRFLSRLFVMALSLAVMLAMLPIAVTAEANGFLAPIDNTVPSDAVYIKTEGELASIGGAHGTGKYFVLANDINLTTNWVSIDDFRGSTFDGRGYTIKNMYSDGTSYGGLFGYIKTANVTIKNVGVVVGSKGISVRGNSNKYAFAGGLAAIGDITVTNCFVKGDFHATAEMTFYEGSYAGGLIGSGNATITDSYTDCSVSASYAGGLVGEGDATIIRSYTTGNVHSDSGWAGGLVGNGNARIADSYTSGNITAMGIGLDADGSAGGLVGIGVPSITNSHATGTVSASNHAGGLVGRSGSVTIEDSYATGTITSSTDAGGLIGHMYSGTATITNSYATGRTTGDFAGGLIAQFYLANTVNIKNCYATGDVSGHQESSYSDYTGGGLIGYIQADAATIENCYAWGNVSAIGYAGGLIGEAENHDTTDTLTIASCYAVGNITATSYKRATYPSFAGGLIGKCSSNTTMTNCFATGNVSATSPSTSTSIRAYAGGLIGRFQNKTGGLSYSRPRTSSMQNCYATGNVVSLSSHEVNDNTHAGGLIGEDETAVTTITNCYRLSIQDIKGNSVLRNDLGTSITAEQMKTRSTFDGWDFNSVWTFETGKNNNFPVLQGLPAPKMAAPNLSTASTWAREGIQAAYEKGFIPAGIQNNYTNVITRQEFCRMAVKWLEYKLGKNIDSILSEKGLSRNQNAFADTSDSDILAAFALGITSGTGNNQFTPDGKFSREQAATMIRNTCKAAGIDLSNTASAGFTDMNTASIWAVDSINFCRNNGIMSGTSSTPLLFSPKGTYTREQSIITFNNIK